MKTIIEVSLLSLEEFSLGFYQFKGEDENGYFHCISLNFLIISIDFYFY